MSHTIYTTDAIVIHSVSTGEADVTLWLLTAELGLVIARAQGARKGTAKMQGYLQTFSLLKVSLVRGKYIWRVTGTESIQKYSEDFLYGDALSAFARIAVFLRRMTLIDTQNNLELFDIIKTAKQGFAVLAKNKGIDSRDIERIELKTVAKILISLGYIEIDLLSKIEKADISQNDLAKVVNNAIANSHL